jgi:outer membrane protein OmpA-like peptidoglycan-associated protein
VISGVSYSFAVPVAITNDGTDVWVANTGGNADTVEFSASTGALVQSISSVSGSSVYSMYADATTLWVAGLGTVYELSKTTGAVVATLAGNPYDFSDATTSSIYGGTAWVTNAGNNTVTEFPATALMTPTTPTISNIPTTAQVGGTFNAVVTTNGDGTISVTSNSPSVCSVNGLVVTFLGTGACSLTASVTAGTTYAAGTGVAQTFVVAVATTTTTTTTSLTTTTTTSPTTTTTMSATTTTSPSTKPAPVTVTFPSRGITLSAADKRSLSALAKKLEPGAHVICTGYAYHNALLARARARVVALYLSSRVSVHIALRQVTSLVRSQVTITTTKQ